MQFAVNVIDGVEREDRCDGLLFVPWPGLELGGARSGKDEDAGRAGIGKGISERRKRAYDVRNLYFLFRVAFSGTNGECEVEREGSNAASSAEDDEEAIGDGGGGWETMIGSSGTTADSPALFDPCVSSAEETAFIASRSS